MLLGLNKDLRRGRLDVAAMTVLLFEGAFLVGRLLFKIFYRVKTEPNELEDPEDLIQSRLEEEEPSKKYRSKHSSGGGEEDRPYWIR